VHVMLALVRGAAVCMRVGVSHVHVMLALVRGAAVCIRGAKCMSTGWIVLGMIVRQGVQ